MRNLVVPKMECENRLLLDKFRCNLDLNNRRCKAIHWTECRTLQAAAALKREETIQSKSTTKKQQNNPPKTKEI